MIEIIDSFQPIDENEVAKLESQLGASFPESFIEFYRVRNGGRLSQIVFEDNHGNFNELEFFLPIATSTRNPVVAHTYICDEFPRAFTRFCSLPKAKMFSTCCHSTKRISDGLLFLILAAGTNERL